METSVKNGKLTSNDSYPGGSGKSDNETAGLEDDGSTGAESGDVGEVRRLLVDFSGV